MNLLRQPYPRDETPAHAWRLAFTFGVFVALFLWLFQPFGISTWQTDYKSVKIWGFGLIAFGVMVVNSVLLPRLAPRLFAERHWTVGREIVHILFQISLIGVGNRLYMIWLSTDTYALGWGWVWSLAVTFLVGIFPTAAAVMINYIRQLKRYQQQAATLSATLPPHPSATALPPTLPPVGGPEISPVPTQHTMLTLVAENEKDTFTFAPTKLLAIESSDNYCTIFYARNETLAKELMRSSLSRLESQLSDFQQSNHQYDSEAKTVSSSIFVRCHRSYVVNLEQVERISGNAQGYKLHLLRGQLIVPVARKYNDTLIAELGRQV
ncbi:LytTR family DNA-binding domain-containing protein [Fibrella aquatilis]|uniref:LytTR family transcriptional regulator n=1 Tax=Fibrella aquatilis TaxID=2817059 RepID=A0A939JUP3_9BACT|nr:LytTR family DNA-binding domain-containing protein [Fibrella aquatilis]MBO0929992.1 LytTR family transcriptional regulator [Fibrella aquatilis]